LPARPDGRRGVRTPCAIELTQRVGSVTDLPLTGQEHEDVAGTLRRELVYGVHDRLGLVPDDRLALVVLLGEGDERSVADLDRIGASGDLDDRRGSTFGGRAC
jgi:hypothetical protein